MFSLEAVRPTLPAITQSDAAGERVEYMLDGVPGIDDPEGSFGVDILGVCAEEAARP